LDNAAGKTHPGSVVDFFVFGVSLFLIFYQSLDLSGLLLPFHINFMEIREGLCYTVIVQGFSLRCVRAGK
jgi:hypothetical protein